MKNSISGIGILALIASAPACLQGDDLAGDVYEDDVSKDDASEDAVPEEHISTVESAITAGTDVGVIPDRNVGCPDGSADLVIRMDDEDDGNTSRRTGWVGKTNFQETSSATRLYFCRVDGTQFKPFGGPNDAAILRDDYAVLRLGTSCPNDSVSFSRHFDNEDDDNRNFFRGNITPNVSNHETTLQFCLFRFASDGDTMSAFPSLGNGFQYGVFAAADFNRGAISTGTIRSDDEDDGNTSTYHAPASALAAAQRIIAPDTAVSHGATILRVAKVR